MPLRNLFQDDQQAQFERMQRMQMQREPLEWGPLEGPEAEQLKKNVAATAGINMLSGVGSLLDIPNSMVRDFMGMATDLAEGQGLRRAFEQHNPYNQLLPSNWFTWGGREAATGRQLLERWNLVGPNVDKSWIPDRGDLAGFGLEVITDPLSYVSLAGTKALSALGKGASKTGMGKVAGKVAGREWALKKYLGMADDTPADELLKRWEAVADPTAMKEVTALERSLGKRRQRALTDVRHALQPNEGLLRARGLENLYQHLPMQSAEIKRNALERIAKYGLQDELGEMDPAKLLQAAIDARASRAFASKRWRDRAWRAIPRGPDDLPDMRTLKNLDDPMYRSATFMGYGPNLRTSSMYMQYSRAADATGKLLFDNRMAQALFKGLRGIKNPSVRAAVEGSQVVRDAAEVETRKMIFEMDQRLKALGEENPEVYTEKLRSSLTNWIEAWTGGAPPDAIKKAWKELQQFDQSLIDEGFSLGNDISPYSQDFGSVHDMISKKVPGHKAPTGSAVGPHKIHGKDGGPMSIVLRAMSNHAAELYGPRRVMQAKGIGKLKGYARAAREWFQSHEHNKARWGVLTGIYGGDETIRHIAIDAAAWVEKNVAPDIKAGKRISAEHHAALEAYLKQTWGDDGLKAMTDAYADIRHGSYQKKTGNFKLEDMEPRIEETGRFKELSRWLLTYTPDELRTGLITNSPLADWQNLFVGIAESHALSRGFLGTIAETVQSGTGPGTTIKSVLEKLNLRGKDIDVFDPNYGMKVNKGGAYSYIESRMHPAQLRELGEHGEGIGNLRIPDDVAAEMTRYADVRTNPDYINKFTEWYDSVNNFFKFHATIPHVAFHARNFYGGQFQNWANGMWSMWSVNMARKIQDGRLDISDKVLEIPQVKQELFATGRELNKKNAVDVLKSIMYRHRVYSDRTFHQGRQELSLLQDPDVMVRDIDALGEKAVKLRPARSLQTAENTGEGWGQYARKPTWGERGGMATGFAGNILRGLKDPVTGKRSGRGLMPHLLKPIPGAEDIKLRQPLKYAWNRRFFHPSDYTISQVRGVSGREGSEFGLGHAMEDWSHYVEGLNRIAPFLHLLMEGVDSAAAAGKVMGAQVDYSARKFSDFENTYLRRLFPFYKWQSRMLPHVLRTLIENPGGVQAQAIRASTMLQRSPEGTDWVPKRVRDLGLAIPLGPQTAEGVQRFLAQIDPPHEGAMAPLVFGTDIPSTIRNMFQGIGGQLQPTVRSIAYETPLNRQLWTGRPLSKTTGNITKTMSNLLQSPLGGSLPKDPADALATRVMGYAGGRIVENLIESGLGRYLGLGKEVTEKPQHGLVPHYAKMLLNTLTGVKLKDYNIPEEQLRELKPAIEEKLEDDPLVQEFRAPYVKKERRHLLSQDKQLLVRLLEQINREARQKRKAEELKLPKWAVR